MKKKFFFLEVLKEIFLFLIYKTNILVKLLKLMVIAINFILPIFLFVIGGLVFISNRKYLLITLLSLEYIVLRLFLFIYIVLNFINSELYFSIVFLTFRVCEGALGLSLLVSLIRTHGNNNIQSFNILLC